MLSGVHIVCFATSYAVALVLEVSRLLFRSGVRGVVMLGFAGVGLVIHSARSCKPYSVGQYDLKRLLLERLNVPSVVIEADITDSRAFSEEQALTRLNAFFETLEAG